MIKKIKNVLLFISLMIIYILPKSIMATTTYGEENGNTSTGGSSNNVVDNGEYSVCRGPSCKSN